MRQFILFISMTLLYSVGYAQSSPCTAVTASCSGFVSTSSDTWTAAGGGIVDPGCGYTYVADGQSWLEYTPTGSVFNVDITDALGGGTNPLDDVSFQIYYTTGACSSTLTYIGCYNNDAGGFSDESETFTTVAGATYYIRIYDADGAMDFAGGGQNSDFLLCIYEEGDNLCAAEPISSYPFSVTGTTTGMTNFLTGGCEGTEAATVGSGEDYFYSMTVAAGSYYTFNLSGTTAANYTELTVIESPACGGGSYSCFSTDNGTWGGGMQADNSPAQTDAPCRTAYFADAGTYYIRVDASLSADGPYTVDIAEYTPSGNDACTGATALADGVATTTSTDNCNNTLGTDDPTATWLCAGTVENTAWLHFQSDGTGSAVTVDLNNITCNEADYLYAESGQFGIVVSSDGTCSGTWSDAADVSGADGYSACQGGLATGSTFSTTLDNTAVTDYYLIWDGNGGAECDFDITVTNVAVLPVEFGIFETECFDDYVHVFWSTISEINNDYFIVQRSQDGENFVDVTTIKGAGTSNSIITYDFADKKYSYNYPYYRIVQVDFDGERTHSKTNHVDCFQNQFYINYASVNDNSILINVNSPFVNEEVEVILYDCTGKIISSEKQMISDRGLSNVEVEKPTITGIYLVFITDSRGNVDYKKIITD